jgi:SRSO17 transposase
MHIEEVLNLKAKEFPNASKLILALAGDGIVNTSFMTSEMHSKAVESDYKDWLAMLEPVTPELEALFSELSFTATLEPSVMFRDQFTSKYGEKFDPIIDFIIAFT